MNIFLDGNNDIVMVDGGLSLVTGIEETRQMLVQRLLSFKGDWFLNLDLGMPYFQTIFKKSTTLGQVENYYLDTISQTPGVLDISTFNLAFDKMSRQADISFTCDTSDGVLDFNLNSEDSNNG